jgi:hypothetical protein
VPKAVLQNDRYDFFEHECEQERAADGEDDIMGAEPGEEDVGLFVAQEVLGSEDGGEVREHDREHDRSRREGRDTGFPAREVVRDR